MGNFKQSIKEIKGKEMLFCMVSAAIISASGWIQNAAVYSQVALYFGVAREINTFIGAFSFLLLAIVAYRKPSFFDKKLMLLFLLGAQIASVSILALAVPAQDPLFTVIGLALSSISNAWALAMLALVLYSLTSFRAVTAALAFGFASVEVIRVLVPAPSFVAANILSSLGTIVIALLLYRASSAPLEKISRGDAAVDLQLSNPESFLKATHPMYIAAFLFSFASGYALTLHEIENAPAPIGVISLVLVVVAFWLVFSKRESKEDSLFSFSALLVIAGFLIAPFTLLSGIPSANAFIRIGIISFDILLWMVIIAVGQRNIFALLPTLGVARFTKALGTNLGAMTGHTSNDLLGVNSQAAALIASIAVFAFIAFLWVGFRKFSFTETIKGVTSPQTFIEERQGDYIEQRCAALSLEYGLTERESEIFIMLARGRNGHFIKDHYVVSRNTVKSHIKHIYQKLDVHSQQELIDLVETAQER